jgi:DNA-binding HxlR family transcriptional regulator
MDSASMTLRTKETVEMCPVFAASRILGKRWSILVIQVLLRPEAVIGMRFNEIQKELSWISPKVLTQRLRELQEQGILSRDVDVTSIPPKVWYTLTEKGRDLGPSLEAMQAWGMKHGGKVVAACLDKGFNNCKECQY